MLQGYYNHEKSSLNLEKLIKEAGHNNTSFAEAIGVSEGAVRKLVNPKLQFNPKTETLSAIADELGVEISELLIK